MFSLPIEDRLGILGLSSDFEANIPIPGPEGIFRLRDIARDWNGIEIITEVENDIKNNSLENLEPEHIQVITAAVISQCEQPVVPNDVSKHAPPCIDESMGGTD